MFSCNDATVSMSFDDLYNMVFYVKMYTLNMAQMD